MAIGAVEEELSLAEALVGAFHFVLCLQRRQYQECVWTIRRVIRAVIIPHFQQGPLLHR